MTNWKLVIGGFYIGCVIILSSIPLVQHDAADSSNCSDLHGSDEEGCKKDASHHCVWCVSRAVHSKCYEEETAKQLPHSVFKCEFGGQASEEVAMKSD